MRWEDLFFRTITLSKWVTSPAAVHNFYEELGHLPHIALPRSYNEKMFWRLMIDRNPAFIRFNDKLATKEIFQSLSTPIPCAELLWTGDDPADFPDALMRDDVVVKYNAGSGLDWFFARDGRDRLAFEKSCRWWLSQVYGKTRREWAYGQVQPKLFAERVFDTDPARLQELKVHLFGGEVFYTVVYTGEKSPVAQSSIYSPTGERLSVTTTPVIDNPEKAHPSDFQLSDAYFPALDAAREIARDLDYIRVDFYSLDGDLIGGEITPYPTAGLMTNSSPDSMKQLAEAWDLRQSWFMQTPQTGWRGVYQTLLRKELDRMAA